MTGSRFIASRWMPWLMGVAGAAAGIALGLAGRAVLTKVSPAVPNVQSVASAETLSGNRDHQDSRALTAGREKADTIVTALSNDTGLEYWLHLLAAADGSSADVLARLLDSLKDEPAALSLLGARWAQLDPAGMFSALKLQGPDHAHFDSSSPPGRALEKIMAEEWFRQNPEALIKALSATDGPYELPTAKEELLRLLGPKDPRQTLKLIVDWAMRLQSVESSVMVPWARANPREAMTLILTRKSEVWWAGDGGSEILREIANGMGAIDPVGVLSMPFTPSHGQRSSFMRQVMEAWAGRDPAAAAAWLAGDGVDQKKRNNLSGGLLQAWSGVDVQAAIAWADAHVTGSARIGVNHTLIPALASQDPVGALEFVNRMPPGFARDEAVMQVTDGILEGKGKEEVLTLFQRITALSDPDMRTAALERAARRMMKAAPEEFMAWLAGPEGSKSSVGTFLATADNLAEKDPETAMRWAAGLREGLTGQVRQNILGQWMDKNPEAAKAWTETLPAGPERHASVASAASLLPGRISSGNYTAWLDSLPASDHPAVVEGLGGTGALDPAMKAELMAKYR